jgi:hypothetical protein
MRLARRIAALLSVLVVAVGIGLVPASAGFADSIPTDSSVWKEIYPPFISPTALKCLDVPSGSNRVGLPLQLWHCHGYASNGGPQRFRFISLGTDLGGVIHYWIVNTSSGLCIAGPAAGAQVVEQAVCDATRRTQWAMGLSMFDQDPNGGPGFRVVNLDQGYCMAAQDNHSGDGTPVVLQICRDSTVFTESVQLQDFRLG